MRSPSVTSFMPILTSKLVIHEDHEVRSLVVTVVVVGSIHAVFLFSSDFSWLGEPTPILEDWSVEAELIGDLDLGAPDKSTLPDAMKDDQARVPEKMLPQLTKSLTIKEPIPEVEETPADAMTAPSELDKKRERERKKAEALKKLNIKYDKDEANKLSLKEIQKRKALELLRLKGQVDKQHKTEELSDLARIAALMKKKGKDGGTLGSPLGRAVARKYVSRLKLAISRNYSLPESYSFKKADVKIRMRLVLNVRGEVKQLKILRDSGDPLFDEAAVAAIRKSAPLPTPPKEFVGEPIDFNFVP